MKKSLLSSILIFVLSVSFSALIISSIINRTYRLSSIATIKNLGVMIYEDVNLSIPLTSINWGILEPNTTTSKPCYIQNTSNVNGTLYLYCENWNPVEAQNYIFFNWTYRGKVLNVQEFVNVNITLFVSPFIENITTFSNEIIIGITG